MPKTTSCFPAFLPFPLGPSPFLSPPLWPLLASASASREAKVPDWRPPQALGPLIVSARGGKLDGECVAADPPSGGPHTGAALLGGVDDKPGPADKSLSSSLVRDVGHDNMGFNFVK